MMSLNLGNDAIDALRKLYLPDETRGLLRHVHDAILDQSRRAMNNALDTGTDTPRSRDDACGYARALRDIWLAMESAMTNVPMQRTEKPGVVPQHGGRR